MRNVRRMLAIAVLFWTSAYGTTQTQGNPHELSLGELKAQQPEEKILDSAPCRRARESQQGVFEEFKVDPASLAPDLRTLAEDSEEIVLGRMPGFANLLSPSGESVTLYIEVTVIRSWKGSHAPGDVLIIGMPIGRLDCGSRHDQYHPSFVVLPSPDAGVHTTGPFAVVLFLRKSIGAETKSVQGLRLAAGQGTQGIYYLSLPYGKDVPDQDKFCNESMNESLQHCDAHLATSDKPVELLCPLDPLCKKYDGMPTADFLREVQSVAGIQRALRKPQAK